MVEQKDAFPFDDGSIPCKVAYKKTHFLETNRNLRQKEALAF